MNITSPRLKTLLAAAAISLAALPAGYAQTRPAADCRKDQKTCVQPQDQPGGTPQADRAAQKAAKTAGHAAPRKSTHAAPRPGDSARAGQPFQRAAASRFAPPPRGQEYRVVGDHLVLADRQTLKVVSVLGLVSALTN